MLCVSVHLPGDMGLFPVLPLMDNVAGHGRPGFWGARFLGSAQWMLGPGVTLPLRLPRSGQTLPQRLPHPTFVPVASVRGVRFLRLPPRWSPSAFLSLAGPAGPPLQVGRVPLADSVLLFKPL